MFDFWDVIWCITKCISIVVRKMCSGMDASNPSFCFQIKWDIYYNYIASSTHKLNAQTLNGCVCNVFETLFAHECIKIEIKYHEGMWWYWTNSLIYGTCHCSEWIPSSYNIMIAYLKTCSWTWHCNNLDCAMMTHISDMTSSTTLLSVLTVSNEPMSGTDGGTCMVCIMQSASS